VEIIVTLVRNLNSIRDYAMEQDYISRKCIKVLEGQECLTGIFVTDKVILRVIDRRPFPVVRLTGIHNDQMARAQTFSEYTGATAKF